MTSAIDKAITEFEILSSFPQYNFDYVDLIKELKAVDYEKRGLEFENENLKKELDAALSMLNKQPAQEPVAFDLEDLSHSALQEALSFGLERDLFLRYFNKIKKAYTHPAPSWQGLSDDERDKIYFKTFDMWSSQVDIDYAEAIERALKEKNT